MPHPTAQDVTLAGARLEARASGALWWPSERLLCVADLHLGKSERAARRGGALLPPYDTAETLDRLAAEIARLAPATVVCLGDSFDDLDCAGALAENDAAQLAALSAGREWVWIAGNHDPAPLSLAGAHLAELRRGGLVFRHAARAGAPTVGTGMRGEVSGHFHPKFRLAARGRVLARACFLHDQRRLILPAFGAYTGGLRADHPAFAALFEPPARAILTGAPCLAVPLALPGPVDA